jgi:PII-like signaling protein
MIDDCLTLTAYFGEEQHADGDWLSNAMFELFADRKIASSIMLQGIAGFGPRHHLRGGGAHSPSLSEEPPAAVIAVDTRSKIEELLEPLRAMVHRGIVTLERARLIRDEIDAIELSDDLYEGIKLTIYVGSQEHVFGIPAHRAICDLLYRRKFAGASAFRGVDGTAHGHREQARFFDFNANVPVAVVAIASGEQIARVLPEIGELLRRPLITLERVRICKRDGDLLERPHALPETDDHGLPLWQKLTIYTSESTRHGGEPMHLALTRELRRRKSTHGVTVLRGTWGFHGDHEPHGAEFFQFRRRVPSAIVVIDTPQQIADNFDAIDTATSEHGLVTSEMVPALIAIGRDEDAREVRIARHRY